MRILATGLSLLLLAATAAAETRRVPQDYDTIQDACNAATDGDTILVSKKPGGAPYTEWVNTTKSLTFVGRNVIWDGHKFQEDGGGSSRCLTVSNEGNVDDVVVRGFIFRNGSRHIYVYGDRAVIRNCSFRNAYDEAITIEGNDATVERCTFVGNGSGANVYGVDALFQRNILQGHGDGGVYVSGVYARVVSNRFVRSGDDAAAEVNGDAAEVAHNVIVDAYEGIYVQGSGGVVMKNKVSRVEDSDDTGIYMYGNGHTVASNTLSRIRGKGIYMYGSGGEDGHFNVAEKNKLRWFGGDGIYVYGNHSTVADNSLSHGDDDGIYMGESGSNDTVNMVRGNTVSDVFGYGVYVSGGGHQVLENRVTDVDSYGVYCYAYYNTVENVVRANRINGFFSYGVYMYAYNSPFHVEDNDVFGGDSWSGGIYVYAPQAPYGQIILNRVSDVGGNGIRLYTSSMPTGAIITDNTVESSGTSWDIGIYAYTLTEGVVSRNTVTGHFSAGVYVGGTDNEIHGNTVVGCLRLGIGLDGSGNDVRENSATGGDGEGFSNFGSNTVLIGNTFLGNRLDVTNNGNFTTPDISAVNVFETGGDEHYSQVWND